MLRRGIIFALLLAVVFLLAAGYFFLTGSFFLTRILTPWIAESAGCPLDIRYAVFQPASRTLVLRDFRLGDPNLPLLTVRRARGRIDLWALCRGEIAFDNVELRGAVLNLCRDASGKWLWDSFGGGSPNSSPVALRIGHAQAEDSRIRVELKDGVRDMRWSFDGVSASAADLRNGGVLKLECCSPFRVAGRDGTDFAGEFMWSGELALDGGLALAAIRGEASFGHFSGQLDRHAIDTGGISCVIDAARTAPDSWQFRNFRLIRQKMQTVTGMAEFSGHIRPGRYAFDVRRVLLSGQLLTFLADLGCGVRPGDARLDWRGRIGGDRDHFTADLNCLIERQAGPAYFGGEKVDLPGFRLSATQNVAFDWRTARADLRKVDAVLAVGGRKVAVIRKTADDGATQVTLNGVELDLLRFLNPRIGGFGFRGGTASGTVTLQPGAKAETLTADAGIAFAGTSVGYGTWRSRPFDAEISGQYFLPLAGGTLKIDRMRTVFSQSGRKLGEIELAGSVPLRGGRSELAWKSSADPDAVLAAAAAEGCRPVRDVLAHFAPLTMDAEGKLQFAPDRVMLKDCRMTFSGEETMFQVRSPKPVVLWSQDRAPVRSAVWEAAFPARLLPSSAGVKLTGGTCRMQGRVNVFPAEIALEGNVLLRKVSGQYDGQPFADLSGGMNLALLRKNDGGYVLRRGTISLQNAGHPALRLESSGSGSMPSGAFLARIQVFYANEYLADLLLPGLVRDGQFSGGLRLSGDLRRGDWTVSGSGRLEKFRLAGADSPVDGELSGEFRRHGAAADFRNGKLTLKRGGEVLADLRLSAEAPAGSESPVKIFFSGDKLDLRSCYEQLGGADAAVPETPSSRRVFDFGPRPKLVRVDLKNMQWGKTDGFALDGTIRLCRNRLTGKNVLLDLGGGRIRWDFDGMDFSTGMMLALSGRVEKPVAVTAVTALFYPDSGFSGTLLEGKWNLNFRRLFSADWGEDLVGECMLRFARLELPVDAANGPLSRILLLPVETVVRADHLIPATLDVREHFRKLWRHRMSPGSPFSRLKFTDGELRLSASDGRLNVKQMRFSGEPLERMSSRGTVRLREPYELELESEALLCSVATKLPIRGTLAAPQTAAWKVFARMPDSTLKRWFDVLSHPGEQPLPKMPVVSPFVRFLRDLAGYRGTR